MGIETAVAVGGLLLAAGSTAYSVQQQGAAQRRSENMARQAQQRADQESARLAAEAEAEATRLANIEKETKKRAIAAQTKLPQTIATSFSGLSTPANVARKKLLGQ